MKSIATILLPLLALASQVYAQQEGTGRDVATKYELYSSEYIINDDATHVETYRTEMRVLKESAVADAKQRSITYSTSVEKAEVIEAYTQKADGRRIDVPKSNYQLEVNSGSNDGAPIFSDWTTLTVVFPEVAAGDLVVLAYRVQQIEAIFPKQLSLIEYFPKTYGYDNVRVRIDAPTSLWAQFEQRGMVEVTNQKKDGRHVLEWTYSNRVPTQFSETYGAVFDYDQHPGFAWSTFRNYAEIARAYGERAVPKAAVTPRIRQLAEEIAGKAQSPRDQARALYDWVATKISYAGSCVGVGTVVPHDTDFILDNRMGDCKDHATLLQALLAAKGITSVQALVNAGSVYRLPKVPVVSTVNHVITYIPVLDMYLDSTSDSTPFGMLPFSDSDKPVLLVEGFREGARTPPQPHAENQQTMKTVVKIRPDGSAVSNVDVKLKGDFAARSRAGLRNISADDEKNMVKSILRRMGFEGDGKLAKEDPKPLLDTFNYSASLEIKKLLPVGNAAAMFVYPLFYSQSPIASHLGAANAPVPTEDTVCTGGHVTEEYVYEFPKGMQLVAIPKDVKINDEVFSYEARYRKQGNSLKVVRVLKDRTPTNICSPEYGRAYKQFAMKVLDDVRSQVLYR